MSEVSGARRSIGVPAYAAMSALLVWHTIAMVAGASSEITLAEPARSLLHPYLTLFRLDNHWGFFAPNVGTGSQFSYVVEDAAGTRSTFIPADKLSRFHPTSIWDRDRYKMVMENPDTYGDAAVASLCREHASMQPVSITLLEIDQLDFWPADLKAGKQPFDPEFVNVKTLKTISCPAK
jgi:hypothetical protein